ncbi:MAG: helix-turn-helix domain-containing protein [Oscillospiraceae bacterium]|jgi:transcriptional regulator with XRE-family HTH domain|nr:helix-turn-helix domain-containing protein [Oscillospiraceae bacterium]
MNFYDRFIKLCRENNEKATPLLLKLGLSQGNLHKWRNGATVNSDALVTLADYFDVSVDYLLGRTDNPELNDKSGLTSGKR